MSWVNDEVDRIGTADELQITTERSDGSLRAWVPIWVVRVSDELYVRSYRGEAGIWYRHATALPRGRIRAAGRRTRGHLRPTRRQRPARDR